MAPPRKDIAGQKFGRLLAIKDCGIDAGHRRIWLCKCDCGSDKKVPTSWLLNGNTKSCGCLSRDIITKRNREGRTHGMTKTGTGSSWQGMINRCYNKGQKTWKYYGGKGVLVCEYLRVSPINLQALIGSRPEGGTIDRKDNDFGYCCGACAECCQKNWPMNVKWSTRLEQSRNRKYVVQLTIGGVTKRLLEWSEQCGVSVSGIRARMKNGKTGKEIIAPSIYK